MSSSVRLASSKASSWAEIGCLQLHRRRASRCAVIRMTDKAILKAGAPMFIRRVSVDSASLVCIVENTMRPVCVALIEMSAVSRSRISPTMVSAQNSARSHASK